jgi:GTPase SAR1 family protein
MQQTKLMSDTEISALADSIKNKPLDQIECEILPNRSGTGMPAMEFDHLFKLIVIGDSGVGKSCLMHRVTTNEFMEDHEVTVGVEFGTLLLKIENTRIKLQIWDTAGQENF